MRNHWIAVASLSVLAACGSKPVETQVTTKVAAEPSAAPAAAAPAAPSPAADRPSTPAAPVVLPAGTAIRVRTTTALSTKTHKTGAPFQASLAQPLVVEGREIAPAGARVEGVVSDSDPGGRAKGRAQLSIRLTSIQAGGKQVAVSTNSFTRVAPGTKKKDAMKIGVGSGVGAAIGAIAGGGSGAAIGAGVGAGAGTGYVLATRGDPAVIASETPVTFKLRNPVTVSN